MSDANRHIDWPRYPIKVDVRGSTEIDMGDLLFLDRKNGLRENGSTTANYSAYSFASIGGSTKTLASNQQLAAENFVGVALYDSDDGVTETIAVATGGLFKFPLKAHKSLTIGDVVEPAGSGTSLYSQKVTVWTSGSTYPLGQVMRTRTRASYAEFRLRPSLAAMGHPLPS